MRHVNLIRDAILLVIRVVFIGLFGLSYAKRLCYKNDARYLFFGVPEVEELIKHSLNST